MGHFQRHARPSSEIINHYFCDNDACHNNPADENFGRGNFRRFVAPVRHCLWELQLDYCTSV